MVFFTYFAHNLGCALLKPYAIKLRNQLKYLKLLLTIFIWIEYDPYDKGFSEKATGIVCCYN